MPRLYRSVFAALVLLSAACTGDGTPGAAPPASSAAPATPPPTTGGPMPSTTPPVTPPVTPSVTPPVTPSVTPTPRPRCEVVRGSRAVADAYDSGVAFVSPTTGVIAVERSIYRSTDGGAAWRRVRAFPGLLLDVVPAGCRTLFLAHETAGGASGRVSRSDDGGATWHEVGPAPRLLALDFVTPKRGFAVEPGSEERAAVLRRTTDGGRTWRAVPLPSGAQPGSVSAAVNGRVLVGTDRGVYRSTDDGGTWQRVLPAPAGNWTPRVWLGSSTEAAWAAFAKDGGSEYLLYRGGRGLASWELVAEGDGEAPGPLGGHPSAIAGWGDDALMAGVFRPGRVLLSTTADAGAAFRRRVVADEEPEGGDLVFGVSGIAWPTATRAVAVVGPDSSAVYRTNDAGRTWRWVALLD